MKEYILRKNAEKRFDEALKRIFVSSKGLGKQILENVPTEFCVDEDSRVVLVDSGMYEYHYDHTDCIWFHPDEEEPSRCPSTCAQYRDGWNDAMQYIFRDGKGYRPYRRDEKYEDD